MPFTIAPVQAPHVPTLGQICFDAFGALQDRHGVERDFESVEVAQMVVGLFASRPDFAGFVASDRAGALLGSNFLGFADAVGPDGRGIGGGVAGVGPITVRPDTQAKGVGRALMLAVMNDAAQRGIARVRLMQEAINTTSLSLYAKLGFDWREAIALMRPQAASADHPDIRPATPHDLPAIEAISRRHYHHSRAKEAAMLLDIHLPGFVLSRAGQAVGYFFPSFIGHGFAPHPDDMADLIGHALRHAPPQFHKTLIPLGQHTLHRLLLERGGRTIKLFNYMTTGPYEPPVGAWVPSIGM